jgi:hypothetical protein
MLDAAGAGKTSISLMYPHPYPYSDTKCSSGERDQDCLMTMLNDYV